jgi:phosphate-selective porin OprO/OprP
MPQLPVRAPWLTRTVALVALLALTPSPLPAQQPQPWQPPPYQLPPSQLPPSQSPPSTADLERRVRELEAVVQQLQSAPPTPQPAVIRDPRVPVLISFQESPDAPVNPSQTPVAGPNVGFPQAGSEQPGSSRQGSGGSGDGGGSGSEKTPVAGWNDGFFLQSSDKKYVLRITGQIQADYRNFLNDADTVDTDSFFIRRARLGIEADMFEYYEFRLLPDFGLGKTVLEDAYMNVHYWDAFQFEVGKFKQPFSYEQLIQDRFTPLVERSMIDQLVPARDEGVMIHGYNLFTKRLDYGIAVSNGEINGDADTNEHKDLNARIAVRPFNTEAFWPAVRLLQVGISGGVGVEQEPVSPATLKTSLGVPWFTFLPTVRADGVRDRWSPELVYFYGGLGFATQYFRQEQELRPAATGPAYKFQENLPIDGYYVMATYLLTGEERTAYTAVTPLRPFDPRCPFTCTGAWELTAMVSRLDVGNSAFAPGLPRLADPTRSSSGANEVLMGFNWYFNKWVRMQFNWEHSWFDSPAALGPGPSNITKHQDALDTRFQVIF